MAIYGRTGNSSSPEVHETLPLMEDMSPLNPSLECTTESSVFSDTFQHAGQASDKLCPTSGESEKDKPSDSTPAPLSRSQVSLLVCLSFSNLLAGSCTVVQSPFFTPEAHLRGLSSAASGAVFSCFALVQMLAFPAMGWLAPRLGVTRLYTLGLLVAGVTTVVFGLLTYVEQPAAFLAWSLTVRSAEAVGTAAAQTAVRTIIINQFPRRVNSAMSLVEGMTGAGLCLGPAIGGSMYALGGYGAPFYTLGALFFVIAAASLLLIPTMTDHSTERTEKGDADRNYRDMLILVLSTADNWLIFAALLVAAMNWTAMDPSMEPYMHADLGIQPAELSLFFLGSFAGYALSSPLWGRLSDYIDNTFLLVAACLAPTALGVLLIPPSPLLGLRPSRLLLGVGMTLREVFQIGAYLPLLPLMVRRSTARGLQGDVSGHALVSAVFGAAYSLGNVLGPVGGGLVTDLWGYPTLATWLGGVTVAICVTLAARGLVYHVTR